MDLLNNKNINLVQILNTKYFIVHLLYSKYFSNITYILFKTETAASALTSGKSAYFITNLSQARERPDVANPLHSALHGPVGNNSWVRYEHELVNNQWRKRTPDLHSHWFPGCGKALYLYHGARWCVSGETDTRGRSLFHHLEDASEMNYDFHSELIELNLPFRVVHESVRRELGTGDRPDLPTKTLFARDVTRGGGRGQGNGSRFFM